MRPSSLMHLYWVRVRARTMQELLAAAGIAVGVGLVFAALVANTSLVGSILTFNRGVVGEARFQVSARGPEGVSASLVPVVRRLDGVTGVATLLEVPAAVTGPSGRRSVELVSGDTRFARFNGALVRRFSSQVDAPRLVHTHLVALPAPLAASIGATTGDRVLLETAHHRASVPLGIRIQRSDYGDLVNSPVMVAPLPFAQHVSEMRGRLSRIFVLTAPGRAREVRAALRRVAPGASVARADHEVASFRRAAYPMTRGTSVFSIFAAFIGFLFAFSAVLLTVPQRRRFIADLRLAGHEPWVTFELLLFDALVLGAAGSLVGVAGGYLAVGQLLDIVPSLLTYAFPLGEQTRVTWPCIALAVATGFSAACVAVLVPLRDVLTRRGKAATRASDGYGVGLGGVVLGISLIGCATALSIFSPRTNALAFGALTGATMLLLPTLLRASTAAFERLTGRLRTPIPTLATLELRSHATRTRAVALASTAAAAVLGTVALTGSQADVQRGIDASASGNDRNADVWVTFPGEVNALATVPFPASRATVRALQAVPGVTRVAVYRGGFLEIGDHRTWVQAPPRSAPHPLVASQVLRGDAAVATRRLRAGGWMVPSTTIAKQLGVRVGQAVTLPSPVPTRLRVAAISSNLGWPPGTVVLNADDYARAWGSPAASALQIAVAADASPDRVATAVRRAVAHELPARVETRAERIARHRAAVREGLSRLGQISVLVLVSAILAVVGAMAGMIWQRRPAIARLKVHGYPEGELWRALLVESALLLGTGCVAGAAFGLYGQVLMSRGLQALTDFPVLYATASLTALGILLLVTVVAVAMIALPGWLAVRVRPAPDSAA